MRKAYLLNAAGSAIAAAMLFAAAAPAIAQEARYSFDIPAQDLDAALKEFGRQTKLPLVYDGGKVRHLRSYPLKGEFTARDGLAQLLEGSGFSMHVGQSGVLMIESAAHIAAGQGGNADAGDVAADDRGIADILVVGSTSQNSDVRRTEDDAQPYKVFTQEDIQKAQVTTLEDFFRTRLSTNTVAGSESQSTSGVAAGAGSTRSTINLRGLGANQTLILVDGRRLGDLSIQNRGGGNINETGQPDINGIPLASIERIEVLSSTAGGIYGGNAVGGVVNIILRHDYHGLELTANYQNTDDLKYPIRRFDVVGGLALEGGKTNITFSGSFSDAGVLQVGDRSFSRKGFELGLRNDPTEFIDKDENGTLYAFAPVARGVNITSYEDTLTLKPQYGGGNLGNFFTFVPVGFKGTAAELGAALKANAGKFNFEQPVGNNGAQRSLLTAPETRSFNVNFRRKFNDWLDVYADYSKFVNRGSAFASTAPPSYTTLEPGAPNNPFNQEIFVQYDNRNLATPTKFKTDTNRATFGFSLHLPHHWAAGFDYTWNWSRETSSYYRLPIDEAGAFCAQYGIAPGNVGDDPDTQCPAPYGNVSDTRPAVDVLLDPDFSQYKLTKPSNKSQYSTTLDTPTFRLSGPVFGLPAGNVNFSGQVQRNIARTKTGHLYTGYFINRNDTTPDPDEGQEFDAYPRSKQVSTSEYGELNIPFFSSHNAKPFLQELSLQASVRHDNYATTQFVVPIGISEISFADAVSQFGSDTQTARNQATSYTIAGRYSPISDITFRASYGTGYTEPTVNQVTTETQTILPGGNFRLRDPMRNNTIQTAPYMLQDGGAGLHFRPERSKSYSAGVILTPRFVQGFRFSADYNLIRKTNEITFVDLNDLLANPDLYPGRLTRAPLTPEDQAKGYTAGVITLIDRTLINLYRSSISSIDFQADYDVDTHKLGHFHIYGTATYEPGFKRQIAPAVAALDSAGFGDGPLKWRGNAGIGWTSGGLDIEYNAQYYSSYKIYSSNDDDFYHDYEVLLQGSRHVSSQVYQDLLISYAFSSKSAILKGLKLSAGVQNLFNHSPPILASSDYSSGGYSGYGDPRLRRFTLTLKKAFGN